MSQLLFNVGSPLTFASAAGDWHVHVRDGASGEEWNMPIIGWSVVVRHVGFSGVDTFIDPVVIDNRPTLLTDYLMDGDSWEASVRSGYCDNDGTVSVVMR